jgi:methyl acetate hydrolase
MRTLPLKIKLFGLYFSMVVAFVLSASLVRLLAQSSTKSNNQIDQVLEDAVNEKKVPGIVAIVFVADKVTYQGAAGMRDSTKNIPMTVDSIFRIASMTKAITSVAVMQLVESGRVKLDEPAWTYLPELSEVQVLERFDPTGKPILRTPRSIPTVRQLLTHTSGFVYDFFDEDLHRYTVSGAVPSFNDGGDGFLKAPLRFDPGSRWEYGIGIDWLGRLVEKVSGQSLEAYFRKHICQPLGMKDTFFDVPPEKQPRVVGDYLIFERMLLDGGKAGSKRLLKSETVEEMSRNQIGDLNLVDLRSSMPEVAKDPVRIQGLDKFGLGFAINTKPFEGGRSAGSLTWAGIYSTFFWIDPSRKTCAVLMLQILPFGDDITNTVVAQFERAVYANTAQTAVRSAN